MEKHVHMGIDEARQQGAITQVNDLCTLGSLYRRPGVHDALAGNEDFPRVQDSSILDVE